MGYMQMGWPEIREVFFTPDGALRDILIRDTTEDDWRTFVRFLRSGKYGIDLRVGGEEWPIPEDLVGWLLDYENQMRGLGEHVDTPVLTVDLGGPILRCWFFGPGTIDMSIAPDEVCDADRYAALYRFMVVLGDALGRPVMLTEEGLEEAVLIRVGGGSAPAFFPENGRRRPRG